jgi:NADH:ubiquinone oxidoreductase subunit 6 (subunit J)
MTGEQVAFFFIAAVTVIAALGMVSVASVFHAALLMVLTFTGIAGLYIVLGAGFLGIIQILIYVGAIAVLMIFAIMLTPRVMLQGNQSRFTGQWPLAAILVSLLLILIGGQILAIPWPVTQVAPGLRDYAAELGLAFMDPGRYLLPFWVVAVLLLVALVGAIVIAREDI